MEYDENEFLLDFAQRTIANLEYIGAIKRNYPDEQVYEVTQLINSLLGLIVFPREMVFKQLRSGRYEDIPLLDLVADGWPEIETVEGKLESDTLYGLITYLRHGIAHGHIDFHSDAHGIITGLTVENYDPRINRLLWKASFSLNDMKEFVYKLYNFLEQKSTKSQRVV